MKKKTKAKGFTFRQRLRADAEQTLISLINTAVILVTDDCKAVGTEINPADVMRAACTSQNKSLRYRLITELANEKVAELERIYNNQQELPLKVEEQDNAG